MLPLLEVRTMSFRSKSIVVYCLDVKTGDSNTRCLHHHSWLFKRYQQKKSGN